MTDAERERQARGLERFLMMTDGVVAIAITLLVLPLLNAVTANDHDDDPVKEILSSLGWELFSFFLSFVVIAIIWQNHRDIFGSVEMGTPALVWAGIGWIMAVILLPVSTALIIEHGDEKHTILVYLTNLVVCIACTTMATWILYRRPELTAEGRTVPWDQLAQGVINLGLVILAFAVAWMLPVVGFWVMLLLTLGAPVLAIVRRRRGHD